MPQYQQDSQMDYIIYNFSIQKFKNIFIYFNFPSCLIRVYKFFYEFHLFLFIIIFLSKNLNSNFSLFSGYYREFLHINFNQWL